MNIRCVLGLLLFLICDLAAAEFRYGAVKPLKNIDPREVIYNGLSIGQRITFRNLQSGMMVERLKMVRPSDQQIEEALFYIESVPIQAEIAEIHDDLGNVRVIYDNGEERYVSTVEVLPVQSTADATPHIITLAGWEDGMFVVETRRTDGLNVLEIFSMELFQLKHMILISSGRLPRPLLFERNYGYN